MAKRVKRVKRGRPDDMTRAEVRHFLGGEPPEGSTIDRPRLATYYKMYHDGFESADRREFLKDYVKANGPAELQAFINKMPAQWFENTICATARMLTLKCVLPADAVAAFKAALAKLAGRKEELLRLQAEKAERKTIKDDYFSDPKLKPLNREIFATARSPKAMRKWVESLELQPEGLREFAKWAEDYYEENESNTARLPGEQDVFYRMRVAAKQQQNVMLQNFIDVASEILKDAPPPAKAAKVRAMRAKKPKAVEKVVEKVRCVLTDPATGTQGLRPEQVVGKQVLYLFDINYRWLKKYVVKQGETLSFHRSSIAGYDEKLSGKKRVRKPTVSIPQLAQAGKRDAEKLFDSLGSKASELDTDRTSDRSLFVRVF